MFFQTFLAWAFAAVAISTAQSTDGILDLVKRRLPDHVDDFTFSLIGNQTGLTTAIDDAVNDQYTVSCVAPGKIHVEGNSLTALAAG